MLLCCCEDRQTERECVCVCNHHAPSGPQNLVNCTQPFGAWCASTFLLRWFRNCKLHRNNTLCTHSAFMYMPTQIMRILVSAFATPSIKALITIHMCIHHCSGSGAYNPHGYNADTEIERERDSFDAYKIPFTIDHCHSGSAKYAFTPKTNVSYYKSINAIRPMLQHDALSASRVMSSICLCIRKVMHDISVSRVSSERWISGCWV